MTVVATDLRAAFPEFADTAAYSDAQVNFWLGQAPNQLSATRFGTSYDLLTMLFVAHNIVLSARAAQSPGGVGGVSGPATSKSVGGVSVSYDAGLTSAAGAGFWNATSYGQRFWTLIRAFSAGPVYVPGPPSYAASPFPQFR